MNRYSSILILFLLFTGTLLAQDESFDVSLSIDYSAAEQTVQLFEDRFVSAEMLAGLRGNIIAASTAGYIAAHGEGANSLELYFDSLKYRQFIRNDIYRLEDGKRDVAEIKELLEELKKRNFNKKVIATVEQIFPRDVEVSTRIPVYVVALGHEHVDAFVRRIVWHGDVPEFVGEDQGELTIVINLAQAIRYSDKLEGRFIQLLGVVAHEVFHAALGVYKEESSVWKRYNVSHTSPLDALLDLVHNEGIAYYLSQEQQWGDYLPMDFASRMHEIFITFNSNALELLSPATSGARINEIIRKANLSGFWESYGSMVGMYIARTIDKQLGREELIETISMGTTDFFKKYIELTRNDARLPKLKNNLVQAITR